VSRRTVRVRMAALYTALSLFTSVVLLVANNLLLQRNLSSSTPEPDTPAPGTLGNPTLTPGKDFEGVRLSVLRHQWVVAGVSIVVVTLVSVAVGWWLAGRMLRPLHRITATARRLSLSNLHERIALAGPRDELTELADTFDAMLERLQRAAEAQARFVANASHELRTPLAIQRTTIQVGLDGPSAERLAEVRERLLNLNRRSERLIDGLLILAQSEHGLTTTEPVALDRLVRQAVEETPAATGITVVQDTAPVTVLGDPLLLTRLVANLLDNAIKYNHRGGSVHLTTTQDGWLTVLNTGPDVPAHRVRELFEPFRRLDDTRTRSANGVGLGLSIAAAIARAHNARIMADPNPGGGLRISVQFGRSAGPVPP
jgi:signal transduction histidine kinase